MTIPQHVHIELDPTSEASTLLCPNCGEGYLHHENVDVYSRQEDEEVYWGTRIDSMGGLSEAPRGRNPSARRGGLRIELECELCDFRGALTLSQHEGQTLLAWESGE